MVRARAVKIILPLIFVSSAAMAESPLLHCDSVQGSDERPVAVDVSANVSGNFIMTVKANGKTVLAGRAEAEWGYRGAILRTKILTFDLFNANNIMGELTLIDSRNADGKFKGTTWFDEGPYSLSYSLTCTKSPDLSL